MIKAAASEGDPLESRLGPTYDLGVCAYDFAHDQSRILVSRSRRLNPFLAIYETSWILGGCDSVDGLAFFVERYRGFSDDGRTLNGAYGKRLRVRFGVDQIESLITELRVRPTTRRACGLLWSADDLGKESLDIPCNILVCFRVSGDRLGLTVFNRSNDIYLGVPYDVFYFHGLQQFVASALGLPVGPQCHVCNSLHLYRKDIDTLGANAVCHVERPESTHQVELRPANWQRFVSQDHRALSESYRDLANDLTCDFMRVRDSFLLWRQGRHEAAVDLLPDCDLGLCALRWFERSRNWQAAFAPSWSTTCR